jgi:hypothetical protein
LRKLETLIGDFADDRASNSKRIADLTRFLERNIKVMRNNWDDKRAKETQTTQIEVKVAKNGRADA